MWDAIRYVSGAFTLLAFLIAALVLIVRALVRRDRGILEAAPDAKRVQTLRELRRSFTVVKEGKVANESKLVALAMAELSAKERKFNRVITGALIALVLFLATTIVAVLVEQINAESLNVWCPSGTTRRYFSQLSIALCLPRSDWEIDEGHLNAKKPDLYIRWSRDPDVHLQVHLDVVPPAFVSNHAEHVKKMASTWEQIDKEMEWQRSPYLGRDGYFFRVKHLDSTKREKFYELYGAFSDSEYQIELFLSYYTEDRLAPQVEAMRRMASSAVLMR